MTVYDLIIINIYLDFKNLFNVKYYSRYKIGVISTLARVPLLQILYRVDRSLKEETGGPLATFFLRFKHTTLKDKIQDYRLLTYRLNSQRVLQFTRNLLDFLENIKIFKNIKFKTIAFLNYNYLYKKNFNLFKINRLKEKSVKYICEI